ncbi:MAG: PIG-L family deacetylase [Eubacteriales bacterium]|nr:PIG-L family deacetylase [Eubacteriales bacterium]
MKKTLLLLIALLLLVNTAFAQEGMPFYEQVNAPKEGDAKELSAYAEFTPDNNKKNIFRMTDRDYDTRFKTKGITINLKEPVYGLYICFDDDPKAWRITEHTTTRTKNTSVIESPYLHQFVKLNGATQLRIEPVENKKEWFAIKEIFLFAEGNLPRYVQTWEEPKQKNDIMVFFAHPDDEMLFFGGLIPTYAGELNKDMVAVVLTPSNKLRKSELLNALWTAGLKTYPEFGPFNDKWSNKLDKAYKYFGKKKVRSYVTELFRKYKPDTVFTHDINGEYGHGMHRMCADAAMLAFDNAADPQKYPESAATYGTFEVQKLYIHLYPENQREFDWDKPLEYFDGLTGFQVAQAGYFCHTSQHRYEQFSVEPRDSKYSCYLFGLAKERQQ